jgi:hypothetical protein
MAKKPSPSKVFGISATQDFWKEVDKQMEETGMTRSAVVVESCIQSWGVKLAPTRSVGRPRKKTVKK